jgi:hypothetical protein
LTPFDKGSGHCGVADARGVVQRAAGLHRTCTNGSESPTLCAVQQKLVCPCNEEPNNVTDQGGPMSQLRGASAPLCPKWSFGRPLTPRCWHKAPNVNERVVTLGNRGEHLSVRCALMKGCGASSREIHRCRIKHGNGSNNGGESSFAGYVHGRRILKCQDRTELSFKPGNCAEMGWLWPQATHTHTEYDCGESRVQGQCSRLHWVNLGRPLN